VLAARGGVSIARQCYCIHPGGRSKRSYKVIIIHYCKTVRRLRKELELASAS